jgi:hypothetical protein
MVVTPPLNVAVRICESVLLNWLRPDTQRGGVMATRVAAAVAAPAGRVVADFAENCARRSKVINPTPPLVSSSVAVPLAPVKIHNRPSA